MTSLSTVPNPNLRAACTRRIGFLPPLHTWEPLGTRIGLAMLALLPLLMLAAALDVRLLHGLSLWSKPIKFALALAVYLLTLGCFSAYVQPAWRARRRFRLAIAAGAWAAVMEMAIITLQSMRGVDSHFNLSSDFNAALYAAMGMGSMLLIAMVLPVALGLARHAQAGRLDAQVRQAMVASLLLTFVLTLVTAGTMAALGGHRIGAAAGAVAAGVPLLGWLRDAGDLRVPHFLATHALHVIPAMALLLASVQRLGRRGVWVLCSGYVLAVLALFAQALSGQPFITI